jgi:hypothetical protein
MLHAGLDLGTRCFDFHLLEQGRETVELRATPPDANRLCGRTRRLER